MNNNVLKNIPTSNLLRGYLIYNFLQYPLLFSLGSKVIEFNAKTPVLSAILNPIIRRTAYDQYCAGETQDEVVAKCLSFQKFGIGSILDYAVEPSSDSDVMPVDSNTERLKATIAMAAALRAKGSTPVSLKMTALCRPSFLLEASKLISAERRDRGGDSASGDYWGAARDKFPAPLRAEYEALLVRLHDIVTSALGSASPVM